MSCWTVVVIAVLLLCILFASGIFRWRNSLVSRIQNALDVKNITVTGAGGSTVFVLVPLHWVLFFVTNTGNVEFFDSLGRRTDSYPELRSAVNVVKDQTILVEDNVKLQAEDTGVCGHYCLYYANWRWCGGSRTSIISRLLSLDTKKYDSRLRSYLARDEEVYNFVRSNFSDPRVDHLKLFIHDYFPATVFVYDPHLQRQAYSLREICESFKIDSEQRLCLFFRAYEAVGRNTYPEIYVKFNTKDA